MIEIIEISKRFPLQPRDAVHRLTLTIERGETLVLLGGSGCGKTTTLKMINRLVEPTSGVIRLDGRDARQIPPHELRRSIGYVFQDIGLFPHMSIRRNAAIALRLARVPARERQARADELLNLVGLPPAQFARRHPRALSGGQQQRVGIARALAPDPEYLLMDEPFGALDAVTRDQLQRELLALKRRLGKTIVFVTHDLFEAIRLADRIAVMNEGRLEQVGTPSELMARPATEFVGSLFASAEAQAKLLSEAAP